MPSRLDIFVGIQYRDKLSVGANRTRLGKRAFHWSIIVNVDGRYHRFDITDGIVQDPATLQDVNPDRNWVYRHNVSNTLLEIPRYLGSIQINRRSLDVSIDDLESLFENVPIPDGKADRTRDNCVSWTIAAIKALQLEEYCQHFDILDLQEFALMHADRRLADFKNRVDPTRYPPSSSRWTRLFQVPPRLRAQHVSGTC